MVLSGTALEIVLQMKAKQFGGDDLTVRQFIDSFCRRAQELRGVALQIEGATDTELADSLVEVMLAAGLAEEVAGEGKEGKGDGNDSSKA